MALLMFKNEYIEITRNEGLFYIDPCEEGLHSICSTKFLWIFSQCESYQFSDSEECPYECSVRAFAIR